MSEDFMEVLGPALSGALERKGYTSLTAVQKTVLDPALAGRDLRISSQTGSGKTVAIGFTLRTVLEGETTAARGVAKPRAIVVAPTRELAKQVEEELTWLFAPLRVRVASATGGSRIMDERRALAAGPAVVVGTPGRLLDHLNRGAIDAGEVSAIVLDEADRMLDLGFREELEAILGHAPEGHRTHLVSATFPPEVRALADRVQTDPVHVQGTRLGAANADIEHLVHLIDPRQRIDAIVNILLANPEDQTLVFARTRAEVGEVADELARAGFATSSLSGEMQQAERTRALSAFKRGTLSVLVATDVAARGIDVQDIARVIHTEPPGDADAYTHRSGRTGRAGRKGTSSLLVAPSGLSRATRILSRAKVPFRFAPIPTADSIRAGREQRVFDELTSAEGAPVDEGTEALARRLAESPDVVRVVARLLRQVRGPGGAEPRNIRPIAEPSARPPRPPRSRPAAGGGDDGPAYERPAPRGKIDNGPSRGPRREPEGGWAMFRVTWGQAHGADTRRLLALVCRRGGIGGHDVGAIRVMRSFSVVEVKASVAETFLVEAQKPDPRDPRVAIRPETNSEEQERPARGAYDRGPAVRVPAPPRSRSKAGGEAPPKKAFSKPKPHRGSGKPKPARGE